MLRKENEQNIQTSNTKVTIQIQPTNETFPLLNTISDCFYGFYYSCLVAMNGINDPNAFHHFLEKEYAKIPDNQLKILRLPMLTPKGIEYWHAIGDSLVLNELRKIPRAEVVNPNYFDEHPEIPKIGGGRALDAVLKAIGMDVLSAEYSIHDAFLKQMKETLTFVSINDYKPSDNEYKNHFVNVVKSETEKLLAEIRKSANENKSIKIDFRIYALKIFLNAFYPKIVWDNYCDKIADFSQTIKEVSDSAFRYIMNPFANLDDLKKESQEKLNPFMNFIMEQHHSYFLSEEYVKKTDPEIIRQIIISLLFAGGDNIKKYLDHLLVELGSDKIRETLKENISAKQLKTLIHEVGRRFTTIHAQTGEAFDNFIIKYESPDIHEEIEIKKGDQLHYTTWMANVDPLEWGEQASEINPEENKNKHEKLNALATFGSDKRKCYGKFVTLAVIDHLVSKILEEFVWEARVDGEKNYHPTEFGFNNGIPGEIEYTFLQRNKLNQIDKQSRAVSVVPFSVFNHNNSQASVVDCDLKFTRVHKV